MNHVFIGGTSGAGKSTLARKIAKDLGLQHENLDDFREEMERFPKTEYWVNYFWNQDPREYWEKTKPEMRWDHLVEQSESFWPHYLRLFDDLTKSNKRCVLESVNILPHLAKDLPFNGIYMVCDSIPDLLPRYLKEPRWSKDPELIKKEVENSVLVKAPRYRAEAEKYGFKCFSSMENAEEELIRLINLS